MRNDMNATDVSAAPAATRHVLVYGTLKGAFHEVGGTLVGEQRVRGLTLFDLGAFPAAVRDPNGSIVGEVWALDPENADALVKVLDQIEGHPNFYTRTPFVTDEGVAVELYCQSAKPAGARPCGERWGGHPRDWYLKDRVDDAMQELRFERAWALVQGKVRDSDAAVKYGGQGTVQFTRDELLTLSRGMDPLT